MPILLILSVAAACLPLPWPAPPPGVGPGGSLVMTAAVTLNGQSVQGSGRTRTLTSPQLKAGETYTFDVKANWTADGKKYEWDRTVTLGSGERSKVAVARGFLAKE